MSFSFVKRVFTIVFALSASFVLSGCAQVKAYDRGVLAKPEMASVPDALSGKMRDHVFSSKEGASGGASSGGGGCGCN